MNAIIAINPQQMQEAQGTTVTWAEQRIAQAAAELHDAQQVANSLGGASLRRTQASSLITKARARLKFYEKVRAALAAGYYIVPPFPIQMFAVRTDKSFPDADRGDHSWVSNEAAVKKLPVGAGEYVNPVPRRVHIDNVERPNGNGGTREVAIYENDSEWQDIEIPVRALKPQIINEVGRALEAKIFDVLGIAPAYRAADPIIIGEIRGPGRRSLSFFVAWWLDRADL